MVIGNINENEDEKEAAAGSLAKNNKKRRIFEKCVPDKNINENEYETSPPPTSCPYNAPDREEDF